MTNARLRQLLLEIQNHGDMCSFAKSTLQWSASLVVGEMVSLTRTKQGKHVVELEIITNRTDIERILRPILVPFLAANVGHHPQRTFLDLHPDRPVRKRDVPDKANLFPMWDSEFYARIGLQYAMVSRLGEWEGFTYEITQLRDRDYSDAEVAKQAKGMLHIREAFEFLYPWAMLSEKQRVVLSLSARGYPQKEIADILSITQDTVAEHLECATKKSRRGSQAKARFWYASNCRRFDGDATSLAA